jgi:hypothetical protein
MKQRNVFSIATAMLVVFALPAGAQTAKCQTVGGVLITNVNAIDDTYNLGPVFGDLRGSVAAKVLPGRNLDGSLNLQHYWITDSGETILFKPAALRGTDTGDLNVVAVLWGKYISEISGGTGKYQGATGKLEYFGLADFKALTLVLRYRGEICTK